MSRRSGRTVQVSGYYRSNGTYVQGYTRSASSSSCSSRSYSASSTSSRCYVDNSYNRQLGRVGKPHGTHVVSRSGEVSVSASPTSSSGQRCYVDNSYNRELGRVGKPLGTHVVSRSGEVSVSASPTSSSGQRCYVDNSYNRELGRVGKPLGTHVVSKSGEVSVSATSSSGQRCYVDNSYNRELGRVGKPLGTHVVSKSGESAASSGQRVYVDNPYNRKLGRVGKPLGTHVVSTKGGSTTQGASATSPQRCYVDNAHNRRLGRVGKPIPKRRAHRREIVEENTIQNLVQALQNLGFSDAHRPEYQYALDMLEREQIQEEWRGGSMTPATDVSCLTLPSHEIIPYAELQLKKVIGRGGFGEVYAGTWQGTPIAFKKLFYQQMSKKRQESFVTEIKVLAVLDHSCTVKMFGAVVEEGKVGIVMEYLCRSLFHAIFIHQTEFSDSKKIQIVSQIASALQYLHTHDPKIAHCDVKSENVLLDESDSAKLGDFGLSAVKKATESSQSGLAATRGQGTPRYSAPEVLRGELLSMKQLLQTDIYSLAIVVFEVVTEDEPFEGLSVRQLEANVGRGTLRPTYDVTLTKAVQDLLDSCWDGSASGRPTVDEFLAKWSDISSLYKATE